MKRGSTLFLRGVLLTLAIFVLAVCLFGIPRVVGAFQWGGYDPVLLGLYIPALPFFFALYQAMKLLDLIDRKQAFSSESVRAFTHIKYCALGISGLFVLGMPYIFYVADKDDAPGVVLIGMVIIFASVVIATFAAVLQKLIQNAVDIKRENDLTV